MASSLTIDKNKGYTVKASQGKSKSKNTPLKRCPWVNLNNPQYVTYHDEEWGRSVHDDTKHFELLSLEGAQAGLSWETVLKKRKRYREVFKGFDPERVALLRTTTLEKLLQDPGIIRNRLKVYSVKDNAKAFLKIQDEYGSFDDYIWGYVNGKPINNSPRRIKDYPSKTELSDTISKDLKQRGFRFVGSTIIYAYLQAAGLINDHSADCFLNKKRI